MTKPLINAADALTRTEQSGEYFAYSMTPLASAAGAKSIGASLMRVPPGKAAFPFHHHYGNEEHFFVLSGRGILRSGDAAYAVQPHDYIVHLPGGPEHAHQLINTGTEELVYLAISSLVAPDVVGYPDSGKTGVRTIIPGEAGSRFLIADAAKRPRNTEEYWQGEDGAQVAAVLASGQSRGQ